MPIKEFSKAKVLVVGDVMLDRYWNGDTLKISQEAPVPVIHINKSEERAGGAANVALNISSLGGQVTLIGIVGKDSLAKNLEKILHTNNVKTIFHKSVSNQTINKIRVIDKNHQLVRIDFEKKYEQNDAKQVLKIFKSQIKHFDVVVLSDYGKGTLVFVKELIKIAKKYSKKILVDPKGKDFTIYSDATLITPNFNEFELVVGQCETEKEIVKRGYELVKKHNLEALLITRGAKGMTLLEKNSAPVNLESKASEVFDVSGAGDTVIAALATSLAIKTSIKESANLANIAAGIVVRKFGTSTVSCQELEKELSNTPNFHSKVMDKESLLKKLKELKKQNKKIVFTNGCFDILHAGHVIYLEQAKALGNILIVAVNDDNSVKKLKGKDRPINLLNKRMLVLAALEMIDFIVPFSEDTPIKLIQSISPNVLVKGGDYKPRDIVGYSHVTKNGGSVKIIKYVGGFSTTNILKKINSLG